MSPGTWVERGTGLGYYLSSHEPLKAETGFHSSWYSLSLVPCQGHERDSVKNHQQWVIKWMWNHILWRSVCKEEEKDGPSVKVFSEKAGEGLTTRSRRGSQKAGQHKQHHAVSKHARSNQDGRSINTAKYMKSYEEQEWRKSHWTIKKTNRQTKAKCLLPNKTSNKFCWARFRVLVQLGRLDNIHSQPGTLGILPEHPRMLGAWILQQREEVPPQSMHIKWGLSQGLKELELWSSFRFNYLSTDWSNTLLEHIRP